MLSTVLAKTMQSVIYNPDAASQHNLLGLQPHP